VNCLKLIELANVTKSRTEHESEALMKDRIDREEPIATCCITLIVISVLTLPIMLIPELNRAKPRNDIDDPKLRKSNTLMALPNLAMDLILKDEPSSTSCITLSFKTEPTAVKPKTETADPTRVNALNDIDEDTVKKFKTLVADPILIELLILILEPKVV
jgi:hypothetical protein